MSACNPPVSRSDHGRRDHWLAVEHPTDGAADRRMGLAHSLLIGCLIVRFCGISGGLWRRRRLSCNVNGASRRPKSSPRRRRLGDHNSGNDAGVMTSVVLRHHRLHADVWQNRAASDDNRQSGRDILRRTVEFHLAAGDGAVSDRIGRKPLLLVFSGLTLLTAYRRAWLVAAPSFGNMLMVLLWLSFLYGSYKWRHGGH